MTTVFKKSMGKYGEWVPIGEDGHLSKENRRQAPIGSFMCYPHDLGYIHNIAEIPEEAARMWLQNLGIRLHEPYDSHEDMVFAENYWLNKMAVLVDKRYDSLILLYNGDGTYYVLEHKIEQGS